MRRISHNPARTSAHVIMQIDPLPTMCAYQIPTAIAETIFFLLLDEKAPRNLLHLGMSCKDWLRVMNSSLALQQLLLRRVMQMAARIAMRMNVTSITFTQDRVQLALLRSIGEERNKTLCGDIQRYEENQMLINAIVEMQNFARNNQRGLPALLQQVRKSTSFTDLLKKAAMNYVESKAWFNINIIDIWLVSSMLRLLIIGNKPMRFLFSLTPVHFIALFILMHLTIALIKVTKTAYSDLKEAERQTGATFLSELFQPRPTDEAEIALRQYEYRMA